MSVEEQGPGSLVSVILPSDLLDQADRLARRDGGPPWPSDVDLRSAESSAYFGLFHALTARVAAHLLPSGSQEDQARVTRLVDHRVVRKVCGWVRGDPPPSSVAPIVVRIRADSAVVDIALACLELGERREEAQYDHLTQFTRAVTLSNIDLARDAVEKVERLRAEQSPALEALLALTALAVAIR